jgi:hypothetical protein
VQNAVPVFSSLGIFPFDDYLLNEGDFAPVRVTDRAFDHQNGMTESVARKLDEDPFANGRPCSESHVEVATALPNSLKGNECKVRGKDVSVEQTLAY